MSEKPNTKKKLDPVNEELEIMKKSMEEFERRQARILQENQELYQNMKKMALKIEELESKLR